MKESMREKERKKMDEPGGKERKKKSKRVSVSSEGMSPERKIRSSAPQPKKTFQEIKIQKKKKKNRKRDTIAIASAITERLQRSFIVLVAFRII